MRSLIFGLLAVLGLSIVGCGNLSPRQKQEIQNKGQIGEVDNMAQSLKAEIGNLKSQAEIQNSQLDRIQQGLANIQSNYENSGIMIFSGSGGLVAGIFGLTLLLILTFHYRNEAKKNEKAASLLAERVVQHGDSELVESVFQSALHTNVEDRVLNLIKKHEQKIR